MTTPEAARLEPCPFCGVALLPNTNQADLYVRRYGTHYSHPADTCYLSGGEVTPAEFDDWNRRAALSQPDEARDATRYRWLRKVGGRVWHITSPDGSQLPDDVKAAAYDDCVDRERAAAMTKEQP